MHLLTFIVIGIFSIVTLARTVTQCGHSAFPPDPIDTQGALDEIKEVSRERGIAVMEFVRSNHSRREVLQVPLYISPNGLSHQPPLNFRSAIVVDFTNPEIMRGRTSWPRIVDSVRRIISECLPMAGDPRPGWDVTKATLWLNVSIINPQAPEYRSLAAIGNETAVK